MHYVDLTLEIRDGLQTYKSHPPIKIGTYLLYQYRNQLPHWHL